MPSSWIKIKSADGEYDGYLALPPAGKGPGLVLFQEIFGVNQHIRDVADQYALNGFVVLAPDVFWRQAPRIELTYSGPDRDKAIALMNAADQRALNADIATTIAALRAHLAVTGKVGAFGFCMGGRLAYLAAASGGVDAAVSYYGGGIQNQLEYAPKVTVPILFHYGAEDKGIPSTAVDQVKAAFAGRSNASFHLYPEADHAFNRWVGVSYHAPSATLAHARTLLHFATHLWA